LRGRAHGEVVVQRDLVNCERLFQEVGQAALDGCVVGGRGRGVGFRELGEVVLALGRQGWEMQGACVCAAMFRGSKYVLWFVLGRNWVVVFLPTSGVVW
jgi:hypothetical protein